MKTKNGTRPLSRLPIFKPFGAFTSDGSGEGVGELLHVFGLRLSLVLLPSENDLNSTLRERERETMHAVKTKRKRGTDKEEAQKEDDSTLAPMTATSAVGQA